MFLGVSFDRFKDYPVFHKPNLYYNSGAMLSDQEFSKYVSSCNKDQTDNILAVRELILEHCPDLVEAVDDGKWFGGLLTYNTPTGMFVYALGPRTGGFTTFHMMPYYGSTGLQERHGPLLKKFLTGKSCIKFKQFAELPEASIRDILGSTSRFIEVATAMMAQRKKK